MLFNFVCYYVIGLSLATYRRWSYLSKEDRSNLPYVLRLITIGPEGGEPELPEPVLLLLFLLSGLVEPILLLIVCVLVLFGWTPED